MNQLDPAIYEEFLAVFRKTGRYRESARTVGYDTNTFYRHERDDPDFRHDAEVIVAQWAKRLKVAHGKSFRRRVGWAIRKLLAKGEDPSAVAAAEVTEEHDERVPPIAPVTLIGDEPMWQPLDGPQSQAYDSPADILLYGGAAGGGKSDLLIGLALTRHRRTILFRREFPQLKALEDRAVELARLNGRYNAGRHLLQFRHDVTKRGLDRQLEFGAVYLPSDIHKYQGRAHDLKGFDELPHFTEAQFRYLIGWNRSAVPGQRVRVVAAGNPPTGPEGDWIIKFWGPWLDKQHPRPAKPGELRWYAFLDGEEREVESGDPIRVGKELIQPVSRSFIPARVEDNRYLMETGYKARLQSLPEPLRSQLLNGDFGVVQSDEPNQLIPTAWVKRAMDRWMPYPPEQFREMSHLGVDVARGGKDRTVLSPRHGLWFGWQRSFPGRETPDGKQVAQAIIETMALGPGGPSGPDGPHRRQFAIVQVDVIGVGGAVHDLVQMAGLTSIPLSSAGISVAHDRTGQLSFVNKRAEWWWLLREALDPDLGPGLMLPPDRELLADLCAPRWELAQHGIKVESKDAIRQRLGRSTDKGDALIYAWATSGDENWVYVRKEIERKRREHARDREPLPQLQVVARTTLGQPEFAFNPDRTRRPEVEPLDPRTLKPGPWWRFDKRGRFEVLDPWARYK